MSALAAAVDALFLAFAILLIARVLLSWVPMTPRRQGARAAVGVLHRTTDWFLGFFRRFVPTIAGLDLSPAVAILALGVLRIVVAGALSGV